MAEPPTMPEADGDWSGEDSSGEHKKNLSLEDWKTDSSDDDMILTSPKKSKKKNKAVKKEKKAAKKLKKKKSKQPPGEGEEGHRSSPNASAGDLAFETDEETLEDMDESSPEELGPPLTPNQVADNTAEDTPADPVEVSEKEVTDFLEESNEDPMDTVTVPPPITSETPSDADQPQSLSQELPATQSSPKDEKMKQIGRRKTPKKTNSVEEVSSIPPMPQSQEDLAHAWEELQREKAKLLNQVNLLTNSACFDCKKPFDKSSLKKCTCYEVGKAANGCMLCSDCTTKEETDFLQGQCASCERNICVNCDAIDCDEGCDNMLCKLCSPKECGWKKCQCGESLLCASCTPTCVLCQSIVCNPCCQKGYVVNENTSRCLCTTCHPVVSDTDSGLAANRDPFNMVWIVDQEEAEGILEGALKDSKKTELFLQNIFIGDFVEKLITDLLEDRTWDFVCLHDCQGMVDVVIGYALFSGKVKGLGFYHSSDPEYSAIQILSTGLKFSGSQLDRLWLRCQLQGAKKSALEDCLATNRTLKEVNAIDCGLDAPKRALSSPPSLHEPTDMAPSETPTESQVDLVPDEPSSTPATEVIPEPEAPVSEPVQHDSQGIESNGLPDELEDDDGANSKETSEKLPEVRSPGRQPDP